MGRKLIIAIDGYSSCGKSTFARSIAKMLNYIYIDSGAMYRAVTLFCMRRGYINGRQVDRTALAGDLNIINIDFVYNPGRESFETFLNCENVENEIRSVEVTSNVSLVSQVAEVREKMVELQRRIGINKGIVMDGRDIGTVVFPDADLKIFMTAAADVRARRRYDELTAKGIRVAYDDIRRDIIARDIADENRDISPLRRADDAVVLDNSRMTVPDQMEWVSSLIENTLNDSRD
ncbi:MAG: (d)CMP kinase [Bacteroidales bacterium]|jgi:cytidylate kinase|nr:(d)CMP kinase [Bacteroidales bacterium]